MQPSSISLYYKSKESSPQSAMHSSYLLLSSSLFFFWDACFGASTPAIYVFGDSLADVGMNDYLVFSVLKANFPYNGIDYPGHQATGRWCNGKNAADFISQKLGLPSPPPYLAISSGFNKTITFLNGVNFASGGAGVLDATNIGQCVSFNEQLEYFSIVFTDLVRQFGSDKALKHVWSSVFVLIIGSNDILNYGRLPKKPNLLVFVDSLITSLRCQLQTLYNFGVRKFAFIGAPPIGCCPSERSKTSKGDCRPLINGVSFLYKNQSASLLKEMKSKHKDMNYAFLDSYASLNLFANNPKAYGFEEIRAACCGLGNLNGQIPCMPVSQLCPDRKTHMFWDMFHPTEKTAEMMAEVAVNGKPPLVFPMNFKQLSEL